jgi:tetratricopeptide (TPR) repeat protein
VMLTVSSRMTLLLLALSFAMTTPVVKSPLEQAQKLQQQGKLKEARDQYRVAAETFRASGDQRNLAVALSAAGDISVSLGDYQDALRDAEEALKLRQALRDDEGLAVDFNTMGLAYESLGDYAAALNHYQQALKINRMLGNVVGVIGRLDNIGNMHFYQARYMDALESYQSALALVDANKDKSWNAWGRKLTIGNIATLYQKLGLEEQALDLYQQISGRPEDMAPAEYAQMLLNEGVLYRHLGDPVKALEVYHSSQAVFRTARNADGEIRALRSIGIVKTMDLDDLPGALQAFTEVLRLSRQSSNKRGLAEASLYLGEVLRRLHRYQEASNHLHEALATAETAGLVEEKWKSLYALGRIAEETGSEPAALEDYRKASEIIESVRAGIRVASLRTDFLADKRDVYDALIAIQLREPKPSPDELLQWMERNRARNLQDSLVARVPLSEARVETVQQHLPPDTLLVEIWIARQDSAAVWVTASASGVLGYGHGSEIGEHLSQLVGALQSGGDEWKQPSRELGNLLLAGLPRRQHMLVVQDGPVNIPFEVLAVPGSDSLLIEQSDITYLPAARMIATRDASRHRWLLPWNRELVAFGDPPVSATDTLAQNERWQPLPASKEEVHGIAQIVPGRVEIHLGADARKSYLLDHHLENLPLLHLSTHAVVDPERPDHSRILLASSSGAADYLFLDDVGKLDLKNVGLVTVSACDTARGKMVAGEGIQAFSQSFLAAGASATVTSLWKIADEPTANFMNQFYYSLARGLPKAEALRAAKLRFLRSNSAFSHPRYWAAFIITGDGWNPTTPVIPWSAVIIAVAAILGLMSLILWRTAKLRAVKRERRKELQFR